MAGKKSTSRAGSTSPVSPGCSGLDAALTSAPPRSPASAVTQRLHRAQRIILKSLACASRCCAAQKSGHGAVVVAPAPKKTAPDGAEHIGASLQVHHDRHASCSSHFHCGAVPLHRVIAPPTFCAGPRPARSHQRRGRRAPHAAAACAKPRPSCAPPRGVRAGDLGRGHAQRPRGRAAGECSLLAPAKGHRLCSLLPTLGTLAPSSVLAHTS